MAKKTKAKISRRKFHRTVYVLEVLSEEEVPSQLDLSEVWCECVEGEYSGDYIRKDFPLLSARQIVKRLKKQRSDPSFFQLTTKGEDLEDAQS